MSVLYIEPFSGLSGDMFLGALCGLADAYEEITNLPEALKLPDGKIEIKQVSKNGIVCQHVKVIDLSSSQSDQGHHHEHGHEAHSHDHHGQDHDHHHHEHKHSQDHHHNAHRHLRDINNLIEAADISEGAKTIAKEIFLIIGRSESHIHNISLEKIHFHEVSGVDSILDIVGSAVMLDKLQITKSYATPVCTGFGMVKTQHGMLPVPAPATADILQGIPTFAGKEAGEKVTPTGAAILKYLNPSFDPPVLTTHKIAYGPGTKDFKYPNVLRLSLVATEKEKAQAAKDQMYVVETNIDDSSAEYLGSDFQNSLLHQGAADFYFTPVQMKKGRPGLKLTALVTSEKLAAINEFILENTSTIGLRYYPVSRTILPREEIEIDTKYGKVKAKSVQTPSGKKRRKIEYESIRALSEKHNLSPQQIKLELDQVLVGIL